MLFFILFCVIFKHEKVMRYRASIDSVAYCSRAILVSLFQKSLFQKIIIRSMLFHYCRNINNQYRKFNFDSSLKKHSLFNIQHFKHCLFNILSTFCAGIDSQSIKKTVTEFHFFAVEV